MLDVKNTAYHGLELSGYIYQSKHSKQSCSFSDKNIGRVTSITMHKALCLYCGKFSLEPQALVTGPNNSSFLSFILHLKQNSTAFSSCAMCDTFFNVESKLVSVTCLRRYVTLAASVLISCVFEDRRNKFRN